MDATTTATNWPSLFCKLALKSYSSELCSEDALPLVQVGFAVNSYVVRDVGFSPWTYSPRTLFRSDIFRSQIESLEMSGSRGQICRCHCHWFAVGKEFNTFVADLTLNVSCWQMVAQIFANNFSPPTRRYLVLRIIVLPIYTQIASLSCHLLALPSEKVWYHIASVYPSDSPCIVCTVYPDAGSHEVATA